MRDALESKGWLPFPSVYPAGTILEFWSGNPTICWWQIDDTNGVLSYGAVPHTKGNYTAVGDYIGYFMSLGRCLHRPGNGIFDQLLYLKNNKKIWIASDSLRDLILNDKKVGTRTYPCAKIVIE